MRLSDDEVFERVRALPRHDVAPETGERIRDERASASLDLAHPWTVVADQALADLIAARAPFTAEAIRERAGTPPSRGALGAIILAAARRGEIVRIGYAKATRRQAHARPIAVWEAA